MEAGAPEPVAIMKMDVKEIPGSQLGTVSGKTSHGELQEVEDEHCLLPGTAENSSTDVSKVVQSSRNGIVYLNSEGKASNFESSRFSESPSLAMKNSEDIPKASKDSEDIVNPVSTEIEDVSKYRGEQTDKSVESTCDNMTATGKEAFEEMGLDNAREDDVGLLNLSTLSKEQNHFVNNRETLPSKPITTFSDDLNRQDGKTQEGNEPVVDDTEKKNRVCFDDKQGLDVEHLHSSDIIHHQNVEDSGEKTDDQRAEGICGNMSAQDEAATSSEIKKVEDDKSDEDPDIKLVEQVNDMEAQTYPKDDIIAALDTSNKPLKEEADQAVFHEEELEYKEQSSNFVSMVKGVNPTGDILPDKTSHGAAESETTIIPLVRVTEEGLQESKAEENWSPNNTAPSLDETSVRAVESQKERKTGDATESETQDRDIVDIIQRVDNENDSILEQSQINKEETEQNDVKVTDEMEVNDELKIVEASEDTQKDNKKEDCTIQDHAPISTEEPPKNETSKENDEARNLKEEVNEETVTEGDEKHGRQNKEEDATFEALPIEEASKDKNQVIKGAENAGAEDNGPSTIEEDIVPDQSTTTPGTEAVEAGHEKDKVFEGLEKVSMDEEEDVIDQPKATNEEETIKNGHEDEKVTTELEISGADHDNKETNVEEVVLKNSTTIVKEKPHEDEDGHGRNKATGKSQMVAVDKGVREIIVEDTTMKDGCQEEKEIEELETTGAHKDNSESTVEEVAVLDHSIMTTEDEKFERGHEKSKVTRGSQIADAEDTGESNVDKDIFSNHSETIAEEQPNKYYHEEEKEELLVDAEKSIRAPIIEESVASNPHTTEIKGEAIIDGQQENKVTRGLQNDVGKDIGEPIKEEDVPVHSEGAIGKEPIKDGYKNELNEDINVAGAYKKKIEPTREEIDGTDHSTAIIENEPIQDGHEESIEKDIIQDHSKETIEGEQIKHAHEDGHEDKETIELIGEEIVGSTTIIEDEPIEDGHEESIEKDTIQEHSKATFEDEQIKDGHEDGHGDKETIELSREEIVGTDHSTTITGDKPIEDGHEESIEKDIIQDHSKATMEDEKIKDGHEDKETIELIGEEIVGSTLIIEDEPIEDGHEESIEKDTIQDHSKATFEDEQIKDGHEDGHEDKETIELSREEIVGTNHSTTITGDKPIEDGHEESIEKDIIQDHSKATIEDEKIKDGHEDDHEEKKTIELTREEIVGTDHSTLIIEDEPIEDGHKESIEKDIIQDHSKATIEDEQIKDRHEDGHEDKKPIELAREEIVGTEHSIAIIEDEPIEDGHEESTEKDITQDHSKATIEDEQIKDGHEEEQVNEKLGISNAEEIIDNPIREEVIVLSHSTENTEDESSEVGYEENKVTGGSQLAGSDNNIVETIDEDVISSQSETTITEKPINDGQEEKVIEELDLVGAKKDIKEPIIEEFIDQNQPTIITDEPVQDGHEVNKVMEEPQIAVINKDIGETITEEDVVSSHSEISTVEVKINDGHKEGKDLKRPEIADADKDNRESTSIILENENEPTAEEHEDKVNEGSQYADLDEDIKESIVEEDVVPSHYDTTTREKPIIYVQEEDKVDETVGLDNDVGEPIIEEDVVIHHSKSTIGEELNSDDLKEAKEIEEDDILNNSKTIIGEEQSRDGKKEDKVFSKDMDIGEPTIGDVDVPECSTTTIEDELIKDEYQEDKVHESFRAVVEVEAIKKEIIEDDNVIDLLETSVEDETQKNKCREYETTGDACATELSTVSDRAEISMEDPQENKKEAKKHTEAEQYNWPLESTSDAPDSMENIERMNLDEGEEQHKYQNADGVMETTIGEEVQKASSDDLRDTFSGVNFKEPDMEEKIETVNFNGEDFLKSQTADNVNENTEPIQDQRSEMLEKSSSLPEASEEKRNEEIIEDKKDTKDPLNNASLEKEEKMICLHETENNNNNNNNISEGLDTDASINYIETTAPEKEQGSIKTLKENHVEEIERAEETDHLRDHETQTKRVVAYSDLAPVEHNSEPVGLTDETVVESENKHADGLITTDQSLEDPAKEVAGVILEEKVLDEDEDIPNEAEHKVESCEMNTEPDIVIPQSPEEKSVDGSSTLTPKGELESMKLERIDGSDSTEVTEHNSVMDNNGDAKTIKEQSSSANFDADAVEGEDTHEMDIEEDEAVQGKVTVSFRDEAAGQGWIDDERENIESNPEEKDEDPIHMSTVNYSTITKTENEEVIKSPEVAGASMEVDKYIVQEQEGPGEIETVSAGGDMKQLVEDSVCTQPSSELVEDVNISTHGEQLHEIIEATIGEEAIERPAIKEMSAEESCTASLEEQVIKKISQEEEVHEDLKKADADNTGNQTTEYAAVPDVSMKLVKEQTEEVSSHGNEKEQHGWEVKNTDLVFTEEATDPSNEKNIAHLEEGDPKKGFSDFRATETSLDEITKMESSDNLNYTSTRSDMSESMEGITENTSKNHEPTFVTLHEDNLNLHEAEEDGGDLVDATNLASVEMVSTPDEENRVASQDSDVEDVKHKTISIEENATENTFIADNSDAATAEQEKSEISDEAEQEKSEIPLETSVLVIQSVHKDIKTTPKVETTSCKTSSDDMPEHKPEEASVMAPDKQESDTIEMKEMIKDEFPIEDEIIYKRGTPLVAPTEGDAQNDEHVKLEENEMETESTEQKISVPSNIEKDNLEKEKDPLRKPDPQLEGSSKDIRVEETLVELEATDQSTEISGSYGLIENVTLPQQNLEAVVPSDEFATDTESADHDHRHLALPETQKTEVVTNREIIEDSDHVSVGDHTDGKSTSGDNKILDKTAENLDTIDKVDSRNGVNLPGKYTIVNEEKPHEVERAEQCEEREEHIPKGVVLADNTVNKEDVKALIQIENIEPTETENLEKVSDHIPVSPSSTKETSVEVDEQCKVASDFEANMHNEGVVKNCDTVTAGDGRAEETTQEDKKGDIIKEAKCQSEEDEQMQPNEEIETTEHETLPDQVSKQKDNNSDTENNESNTLGETAVPTISCQTSQSDRSYTEKIKEDKQEEDNVNVNVNVNGEVAKLVNEEHVPEPNAEKVRTEETYEADAKLEDQVLNQELCEELGNNGGIHDTEKQMIKEEDLLKVPNLVVNGEESVQNIRGEEKLEGARIEKELITLEPDKSYIEQGVKDEGLKTNEIAKDGVVNEMVIKAVITVENIEPTESENLEKAGDDISPPSTKETSVEVDEQDKGDSDFEANMHTEGVIKSCDTVTAGDGRAKEASQEDKKGDIIKETKCESEHIPVSPSLTKETSVEGDQQCKVESDAEANMLNGGFDKSRNTVPAVDGREKEIPEEDKKGDIVKEDVCESEEDQQKQPNEEMKTTEHETLADEVPKKQDNISDRSYTEKITEDKEEEDNVNDEVANEEYISESNAEKDRTEETYEANAKLEDGISNQEVCEKLGNSSGIHDTVKQMIKEEELLKETNLVVIGEESVQKVREEKLEGAKIEKESVTLEPDKTYLEQGVKDEGLKTNEITQDENVNEMLGSSPLVLVQKDISQEDLTGETGPFSVKDEEDKSRKCDALLIRNVPSEEVSMEEGKQVEEETDFIHDEQIQETNTKKQENMETVSKDASGPEGFVEVMKPSDSAFGAVTLKTTDNLRTKEDLPTDNTNVTSFKEASQEETEEKEGQSTEVEEKEEVLFITEPTNKVLEESGKNVEPEALVAETSTEGVDIMNELELQEKLCSDEDRDTQLQKHPDTPDATAEMLTSMEADSDTRTEETISVSSPSFTSWISLQATEIKDEKHGEPPRNDLEMNKEISEVDKEMHNLGEEKDRDSKSLEEGVALSNLLIKTKEETGPIVGELKEETQQQNKEDVDNIEDEKENEGEEDEDEDEHKKDDSGSDAPVMVEASKDIVVKTTPKKSHGILSGVGSKVKLSISKVKKAITGKSSHQKQSSPK